MKVTIRILVPLLLMINSSAGIYILELLADYGLTGPYGMRIEKLPRFKEYDFIIVGSGAGGAPVANRLSENQNWKVLLLEAGKPEGILHQIPAVSFVGSEYDWQYVSVPQEKASLGLIDRRGAHTKGKSVGGSSSINGMVYARGNRIDFDLWAKQGNYGWSYDEILPYFKKSERARLEEPVDEHYHGREGYLHVQTPLWRTPLSTAFVNSAKELGYDVIDYNGEKQVGFSYSHSTRLDGSRCSASRAFLRVKRLNLDIVPEATVTKVLIDKNNRAYGVEFIKNNRTYRINASKEVILSAGTISTPQLLMLSGIGPKKHLDELGIKVVKDAKVGYNFCDHVSFPGLTFLVNQSVSLIVKNTQTPETALEYAVNGTGPYSTTGGEALAFTRTKYATDARPDLELLFFAGALHADNDEGYRAARRVSQEIYDTVWKPIEGQDAWMILPAVQLSRSKGRIKLKSTNIEDHPIIDPNLLHDPIDLEILVEGIKLSIAVSKTKAFQQYGSKLHDIKIPGCENFEFASDDYWYCALKLLTYPFLHEVGTAKMGPSSDSTAVVDPELRVYGVKGLRVVDASIMPEVPVGHLVATVYMIGEKGADMIKCAWST
ncbi:glucose dehydrogenase [FAD, quinone]-like [Diachasma alloeum]|uniref:glucose dehydrogenase [FAD, quinone]-like n=1 Tax=Diachasma alloeum TaxID=454923 RepID=UPI000738361D|nr:glucose dehydrogenase [FAD, quinone]-like [Diachasma alloeum]